MSSLHQQRLVVDQLRREAGVKRIIVSQAVEDLKRYVTEHKQDDCLVVGFGGNQRGNPFREKSSCSVL